MGEPGRLVRRAKTRPSRQGRFAGRSGRRPILSSIEHGGTDGSSDRSGGTSMRTKVLIGIIAGLSLLATACGDEHAADGGAATPAAPAAAPVPSEPAGTSPDPVATTPATEPPGPASTAETGPV